MNLKGKGAIITDAGRGVGKAIARGVSPPIGNYAPGTGSYKERIIEWL